MEAYDVSYQLARRQRLQPNRPREDRSNSELLMLSTISFSHHIHNLVAAFRGSERLAAVFQVEKTVSSTDRPTHRSISQSDIENTASTCQRVLEAAR